MLEVRNHSRDQLLGHRVGHADRYWSRLRGLLGRKGLEEGEGLLISPSRGVHMFGMRFPLDVVLLDPDGVVHAVYPELAPGRTTGMHRGVRHALELPVGIIATSGTQTGDKVQWTRR
ncbi:DUF192 domain-containing protein [soil metagenome]